LSDVIAKIRKAAIINAIKHNGKAELQAVLGNLMGDNPNLRSQARELIPTIREIIDEINSTPIEQLSKLVEEKWQAEISKEKQKEEERQLPPLPNAENYATIITRIAPNPDFVLHLGNARAAILSHDYARMYRGKFIVRFEDTDPRLKKAQLEYYDKIREDLHWLECDWDQEYIQSNRLPIYYEIAQTLVHKGAGYVCECDPEKFRQLTNANRSCPDRNLDVHVHEERWRKMVTGEYKEGAAVFRIKTDLKHPNPAVRDWPALRVIDTEKTPHPRVGTQFKAWPLYNLASGADDHLLGITHIIRGKEHLTNMARQIYLYEHMGWKYPDAVHYGRLKVEGMNLSKSKLMKALETGEVSGVDDPRLGTLAALRRRGYTPDTIRKLIWEVGPKPIDVTISWDNLNSLNRKIVDPIAHRYFCAPNPALITVRKLSQNYDIIMPLHPQHPNQGTRTLKVHQVNGQTSLNVAHSDLKALEDHKMVRMMGLFNVDTIRKENGVLVGQYANETTSNEKIPIIQWVPSEENLEARIVMPDASIISCVTELGLKKENVGAIVQFVRVGFCRVDNNDDHAISLYYAHQ
jgi:glutamyl-tRNA synthetase